MPATPDVQQWTHLTRAELEPTLRAAVRHRFQEPGFWARVRDTMTDNQVFGGHVRGLLAQFKATATGTDEEAFWLPRIVAVRAMLAAGPDPEPASAPAGNRAPAGLPATAAAMPVHLPPRPAGNTAPTPATSVPAVVFRAPAPATGAGGQPRPGR